MSNVLLWILYHKPCSYLQNAFEPLQPIQCDYRQTRHPPTKMLYQLKSLKNVRKNVRSFLPIDVDSKGNNHDIPIYYIPFWHLIEQFNCLVNGSIFTIQIYEFIDILALNFILFSSNLMGIQIHLPSSKQPF